MATILRTARQLFFVLWSCQEIQRLVSRLHFQKFGFCLIVCARVVFDVLRRAEDDSYFDKIHRIK